MGSSQIRFTHRPPRRARETVERFAERLICESEFSRLIRESDFSTSSFRMFIQELRAAWHLEPGSKSRPKDRVSPAPPPRLVLGCFRHGGIVGVTSMTRHWPQTTMYLNAFLRTRCEEDGVEAEPCNALAISLFDAQNRRGTHNFLYCAGGELWLQDAGAVSKEGSGQHRPQPFTWQDESNPDGLPGFKIPVKERLVKFDAKGATFGAPAFWRAVVAYSAHTLGEPLAGSALRLGFGSHYTFSSAEGRLRRAVGAWSVFTPLTEAVLLRCSSAW